MDQLDRTIESRKVLSSRPQPALSPASRGSARHSRGPEKDTAHVFVCRTCPRPEYEHVQAETFGGGQRIAEVLEQHLGRVGEAIVRRVECLSGCRNPCNVRITSRGKASYAFHRMAPADADELSLFVARYLASAEGNPEEIEMPAALDGRLAVLIPPRPLSMASGRASDTTKS